MEERMRMKVESVPLETLKPYDNNAKRHTPEQIEAVGNSIREFGFRNPIIAWHNEDGVAEIVAGHARAAAAKSIGMQEVPVVFADDLTDAQRRALTLVDNQTTVMTGWDEDMLAYELDVLAQDFDMSDFGFECDLSDCMAEDDEPSASLADRFGVPPFSVLDARKGEWGERKRAWLALGIRSELGRGGGSSIAGAAVPGGSPLPLNRARG